MDQMTESMQSEIDQLEAAISRLDEQRQEKKTLLTRKRKALKLWNGEKPSANGGGDHGLS